MVQALAASGTRGQVARAFEEYLEICAFLDAGLAEQARLNLESLERATGRRLAPAERERAMEVQRGALRWTYLGSGMTHPSFLATLEALDPAFRARVEEAAPAFR